jgi:hypothetical protein
MANLLEDLENLWAQLLGFLAKWMSHLGVGGNDVPKLLLAGLLLLAVGMLLWVIGINLRIGARARTNSLGTRRTAPRTRYNPSPTIEELRALSARRPASTTPTEPDTRAGTDFLPLVAVEDHHELPMHRDAEPSPAEIDAPAELESKPGPVEQQCEALGREPANPSLLQKDSSAEIQPEALGNTVEERFVSQLDVPTIVPSTDQDGFEAQPDELVQAGEAHNEPKPGGPTDARLKAENSVEVQLENAASLLALVRQLHDTIVSQKAMIEELRGIIARQAAPSAAVSSSAGFNGSGESRHGSDSELPDKFEEPRVLLHNELDTHSQTEPA